MITCTPWQEYVSNLGVGIVSGLTVLDVGGGGSDFTAHCVESGARALAIDPAYAVPSELHKRCEEGTASTLQILPTIVDPQAYIESRLMAYQNFANHFNTHRDHYSALPLTSLELDSFFDLIVSHNTLTHGLDRQWKIFYKQMMSAIRLTKSGGKVFVYPWLSGPPAVQPMHQQITDTLADYGTVNFYSSSPITAGFDWKEEELVAIPVRAGKSLVFSKG